MPQLLMLKGLPASGKSTWAKNKVASDHNWTRVNKDDLRDMLHGGKHSKANEKIIITVRDAIIIAALQKGRNVVVDDTNFAPYHETRLREIATLYMAAFEIKEFPIDLDEAIRRDLGRARSVGESVIRRMYTDYLLPKIKVEYKPGLQDVIIVDMDGTLTDHGTRNVYDPTDAHLDQPHYHILHLVKNYMSLNRKVIIVSGRDEGTGRRATEKWLMEHDIHPIMVLMRPSGDMRKDSIVKKELYDTHIKGKFNVEFVLDDRNQVVNMWREQGLPCLQVADGNF